MANNQSVEFFLRFLNERFAAFREAQKQLLQAISLEDRPKKIDSAKNLIGAIENLKCATSAVDRPGWIAPLEAKLNWYLKASPNIPNSGLELLTTLFQLHSDIINQKWEFADTTIPAPIDFSAIYNECYKNSRLPQLFDELVVNLEAIVKSGAVDSLQAIQALQKLIATIRKNARGDYFATGGTWEFTRVYFRNLIVEVLENIPMLKHPVKALRKTMSELDVEMHDLHDHIRQKLTLEMGQVQANNQVKYLEPSKDDLSLLDYKPLALPPAEENDQSETPPV